MLRTATPHFSKTASAADSLTVWLEMGVGDHPGGPRPPTRRLGAFDQKVLRGVKGLNGRPGSADVPGVGAVHKDAPGARARFALRGAWQQRRGARVPWPRLPFSIRVAPTSKLKIGRNAQ